MDIVVAIICLTIGLPVYLVIALLIVLDDLGNPIFVQDRVGKDGKVFKMFKFRTMYKDAESRKDELKDKNEYNSVHFKIENDPRITRIGRILRRTSLDEIPQAINLLTGSMSIIGPRPFIPEEQAKLPRDRLKVKPGMSYEDQLELDYRYIRERSMRTDIRIVKDTVKIIIKQKNV